MKVAGRQRLLLADDVSCKAVIRVIERLPSKKITRLSATPSKPEQNLSLFTVSSI